MRQNTRILEVVQLGEEIWWTDIHYMWMGRAECFSRNRKEAQGLRLYSLRVRLEFPP